MPHKMTTAKPLNSKPREQRPSAYRRGYDARHRKLRLEVLALNPVCTCPGCGKGCCNNTAFSTDADHLKYPAVCVEDYRALCRSCHMRIHAARVGSQNEGR